jgi:hypothetical protein
MSRSTGLGPVGARSARQNKPHLYPIFGGWICCGKGWSASGNTPQAAYKRWTGCYYHLQNNPRAYYATNLSPWLP